MKITKKCINTLRIVSAEMVSNSQMGDTIACFNSATAMFSLFKEHYNFFGANLNINRDRFVLADISLTPLYYAMLNIFGLSTTVEGLKKYGTTENNDTPITPNINNKYVDATIEGRGQGIPTAVGFAIASQSLASKFNVQKFHIISSYTYCFISNDNLEEGISQEAMSLAGSLKLSKLILLCNFIPEQSKGENIKKKYEAMGWNVIKTKRINNSVWISFVITRAKLSKKPTLILFTGSLEIFESKASIPNKILTKNEVEKLKADLSSNGSFNISNEVRQYCARTVRKLKVEYTKWEKKVYIYKTTHPNLSQELNEYFVKEKLSFGKTLKNKIEENIQDINKANTTIIYAITNIRPCIMLTSIKEKYLPLKICKKNQLFSKENYRAKNLIVGNRENAMAEISNGISLFFEAPTFVFAPVCLLGQMFSGVQHSAKLNLPVLYVLYQNETCINSIKDNVEFFAQLEWINNIENLQVYKPANSIELLACYNLIYEKEKPSCLLLNQSIHEQELNCNYEKAQKGAYVLEEDSNYTITLIASGRELYLAKELKMLFNKDSIKVKIISVPSISSFQSQTKKYQRTIMDIENENFVVLTTTDNIPWDSSNLKTVKFVNINKFTNNPNELTPVFIKNIYKKIK